LSENGTASAVTCHWPPAFEPAAGIGHGEVHSEVRLLKFATSVAWLSAPPVLFWFVGEVAAASVYVTLTREHIGQVGG
jgi:hypothetical protein